MKKIVPKANNCTCTSTFQSGLCSWCESEIKKVYSKYLKGEENEPYK